MYLNFRKKTAIDRKRQRKDKEKYKTCYKVKTKTNHNSRVVVSIRKTFSKHNK